MDISQVSTSQLDMITRLLRREAKRFLDTGFISYLEKDDIKGAIRRLEEIAAPLNRDGVSINPSTQSLDAILARVVVAQIERIMTIDR